ncbi:MAG: DUF1566 domain-containing protein [Muribaculaceae bacterium]|nr:DUF1566 domain-containing protein [Muribaculaceae bacterium]
MKRFFQILVLLFAVSISSALAQNKSSYKVGDYYNDGKKTGFVFYVDETGRSGKIISLQQTELPWYQAAKRDKPQKMGLENEKLGLINLVKLRHNEGWHEKFPAFAWCADLGEGWYLPSVGEWQEISRQSKVLNNAMITFPGAHDIAGIYWSSNEDSTHEQRAWSATHYGGSASMQKTDVNKVRAVANFKLDVNAATNTPAQKVNRTHKRTTATQTATTKTYKVGDYYNDGTKEGVVFWVDATGKHGKIVSLTQECLSWCTEAQYYRDITVGAILRADGKANTDKVMARADRAEYPAFVWCRNKGKDWYLPAVEELKLLLFYDSVHDAVNRTLESRGGTKLLNKGEFGDYWSSTEGGYFSEWHAWCVYFYRSNFESFYSGKHINKYVRAVSAF